MAAAGGDQQGALGRQLALHFGQVGVSRFLAQQAIGLIGREGRMAVEVGGDLQQVVDGQHLEARGQAGFLGIGPRYHQGASGGAGGQGGGQHALYRAQLAGFVVTVVAAAITAAIPPLLFRSLLDNAVPDRNRTLVAVLAIAAVGLAFANALLSLLQRWFSAKIGEGLICDLRIALFDHVQHMPIAFFTRAQTGALQSRLNNDVIGAQQAVTSTLGTVVSNVISNVPAVLLLAHLVPQLPDPATSWLTLAMASTLAGNLTLVGSIANLIVLEGARRQGHEIGFWEYCKVGIPVTLTTLAVGALWLMLR